MLCYLPQPSSVGCERQHSSVKTSKPCDGNWHDYRCPCIISSAGRRRGTGCGCNCAHGDRSRCRTCKARSFGGWRIQVKLECGKFRKGGVEDQFRPASG